MAKKPVVKTIHHMDIAASLEAQNNAVMMLLQVVRTAISLNGDKLSPAVRDALEEHSDAVEKAMWPQEGE